MASVRETHAAARPAWALPAAIVGLVYIVCFLMLPSPGLWINDNGAKLIQVQSIIQGHYRDYSIPWPGAALDPSFRYNPIPAPIGEVRDGRLYVTYSQPFAVVSSIPYRLFGFRGLGLLPLVCGLLLLPAVAMLAELTGASRGGQRLAVFIAGLGTPVWFYSLTFWEHTPAACLGVWSLVLLLRHLRDGKFRSLAWSAVLVALSVFLRADMLLVAAALLALLVMAPRATARTIGLYLLAVALTLMPLLIFQWRALGDPFGLHLAAHSPFAGGLGGYLAGRGTVIREILFSAHANPWLSAILAAPFLLLFFLSPRLRQARLDGIGPLVAILGFAAGVAILLGQAGSASPMWGLVHANGLFAASAVLILAFLRTADDSAVSGWTAPDGATYLWRFLLMYVLAYVAFSPTSSTGIHWGCRFLLPVYPIMAAMTGPVIMRVASSPGQRRRLSVGAVAAALALSFAAQVYSVQLLVRRTAFSARLNEAVAERPERIIVVNGWFLPQDLAPNFHGKQIFLVQRPEDWDALPEALGSSRADRVLLITWPHGAAPRSPDTITLDDGMGFISVDIGPVNVR